MFSVPLRLAVGILVLVMVPSLTTLVGRRQRPPREPPLPTATPEPSPAGTAPPHPPASLPASEVTPARPTGVQPAPTRHARLVLDGYFAQRIGLLAALRGLEVPGKTVQHHPQDHLVTALVNVLAGQRQLQAISRGDNPLRGDRTLAQAWDQEEFPEVSSVCRQLHATQWSHTEAVRARLDHVFAPYVARCAGPTLRRGQRLVVDWDLTPKSITTEAKSDPFAAYGHMEEGMGKGYQWAEAVLRGTSPEGQERPVALGGFLAPGNAHPDSCLERLRSLTEATLGRPRRHPDLLGLRLGAAQTQERARQARVATLSAQVRAAQERVVTRQSRLQAIHARQAGRRPEQQALLARDRRAEQAAEKGLAAAEKRRAALQERVVEAECARDEATERTQALQARLARLEADNAALDASQQGGTPIELVLDAQFGASETVALLREEGYDLTTKAISPATMEGLLRRVQQGEVLFGPWEPISANAEVAECVETHYAQCPFPVRLVGYRKHLAGSDSRPAQTRSALFITSISATERPAGATAQHYHVRGGTAELLNRQAKSHLGFRGHRLRHGPGLDILGQFVFAGLNFVPWLADTLWAESAAEGGDRPSLAELTQMARAPGQVLTDGDGVAVQFAPDGGWPQRALRLGALRQPPLPGFVWPGVPVNAQGKRQSCNYDLVARKLG